MSRLFLSPPWIGGDEQQLVADAIASNWIAPLGPHVDAFEREFAEKVGMTHAAALSSGTAALHLALQILSVQRDDEVLVPTLTFMGGVSPVTFVGAQPVFIDSERVSWNVDPDLVSEELESAAKKGRKPKAVIVTDLYGQAADLDRILAICEHHGIPVVSDTAEALGTSYKGRHAGKGSRAAVFSFNGNKIITTSGGGMLASDDGALIARARFLAQQARDPAPHYEHSEIGYNYRMSNLLAALGRAQLATLDERVRRRRAIFARYQELLGGLRGLEFMPEAPWGQCTRWLSIVLITPSQFGNDREAVRLALEAQNIESRPVWKPMHLQPVFKGARVRGGAVAEDLFARGLCLPSGTGMTDEEIQRVAEIVHACHRSA
ncbi:MAG: aminotransferase class I/II-fold pyridoxal phosphate-dependent enzyme [Candidatus Omnitrophota bacterium]